jgi:hypothetical protein
MTEINKKFRNKKNSDYKICVDCGIELTEANYKDYKTDFAKYLCMSCLKIRGQIRYINRKDKMSALDKAAVIRIKKQIIEAYGGKCVCCGEDHYEFLTIDHINNDGYLERSGVAKNRTGTKMYRWLLKNNCPKDNYQLLCFNCNCSKGNLGYCPHHPEIKFKVVRRNKKKLKEFEDLLLEILN